MINSGKFSDRANFIQFAGKSSNLNGDCVEKCMKPEKYYNNQVEMSKTQTKFSKTLREITGQKQIHHGIYNDTKEYENYTHGMKTPDSDHLKDCIYGTNLNGAKYYINEMNEQKYVRSQKEPLGKTIQRNYIFPEEVQTEKFQFGVPTQGRGNLKELIYTCPNLNESEESKKLYRTSHGFSDTGEQKNRNYNWNNIDKNSHSFGKPQEKEYDGTKKTLMSDFLESSYPKTKIVDKRLEDYRQATEDMLGVTKYKGTLNPNLPEDHAFGVKSVKDDEKNWNLGKCLIGESGRDILPDKDLGKNVIHKSKLSAIQPKDYDPNKTFGVPSVRFDLAKKKMVSVSDINNYGNEKDAFELLYPNPHIYKGVNNEDFETLITPKDLKEILNKKNYDFKDEEFQVIYNITLGNYPNSEGKISYKAFVEVMRNLKRDYVKYRGIFS